MKDYPATVTMEGVRSVELAPYRWWAEGEQRGCQMTAEEEGGAGGWVGIHEPPGSQGFRCMISSSSATVQGLHSTPCSHSPWLASLQWARSPALLPGLTGWALPPGRSSAQTPDTWHCAGSLIAAGIGSPSLVGSSLSISGEMVDWAMGLEWIWWC